MLAWPIMTPFGSGTDAAEGDSRAVCSGRSVKRRGWLLVAGLGAIALGLPGCLSPTLPLPPPDAPYPEGPDHQGYYRLTGTVPAGPAEVMVLNYETDRIFGQNTADGAYEIFVAGSAGDGLALWYTSGGQKSSAVGFVIPESTAAIADDGTPDTDAGAGDSSPE